MSRRTTLLFLGALLLLLILPFLGSIHLDPSTILTDNQQRLIFLRLRLPRVLLAFFAGGLLAVSGLISQNLFRNHLATPDILGVTTGAAAGAVIGIKTGWIGNTLGWSGAFISGTLGGLTAVLLILSIIRFIRDQSVYTLLMTGLAVNLFFSSLIVLAQYLFDFSDTFVILRWLMGGLAISGYTEVVIVAFGLVLALGFIFMFRRELVLLSTTEEFSRSKGLDIDRFRIAAFLVLAVLVAAVVSVTGPIGFIALIIPHIGRMVGKNQFGQTAIASTLLGAIVLMLGDFLGRTLIAPVEIPVGIITSFLGAPFFLLLLISSIRRSR